MNGATSRPVLNRLGQRAYLLWCALRRWFKCRVRGLHIYKFTGIIESDGRRLLQCGRCKRTIHTDARKRERKTANG